MNVGTKKHARVLKIQKICLGHLENSGAVFLFKLKPCFLTYWKEMSHIFDNFAANVTWDVDLLAEIFLFELKEFTAATTAKSTLSGPPLIDPSFMKYLELMPSANVNYR